MVFDDSDMKIVGAQPAAVTDVAEEELKRHQENGNLDKAKVLGAALADKVLAETEAEEPFLTEGRILRSFAVLVGLESYLPVGLPVQTARGAFYEALMQRGMYETICGDGAFSFYYLCLNEGAQITQKIGETYARLCNSEDAAVGADGQRIYLAFLADVQEMAFAQKFI